MENISLVGLLGQHSDCPRTVLGQLGQSSESTWTMWLSVKYWKRDMVKWMVLSKEFQTVKEAGIQI